MDVSGELKKLQQLFKYVCLNNNDRVRIYTALTGNVATVFSKRSNGYVRISTTVPKEDSTYAVGTVLATDVANALDNEGVYIGMVTLFGKKYMSMYRVLRSSEVPIGALFIGIPVY